jgi:hypothetical protein
MRLNGVSVLREASSGIKYTFKHGVAHQMSLLLRIKISYTATAGLSGAQLSTPSFPASCGVFFALLVTGQ